MSLCLQVVWRHPRVLQQRTSLPKADWGGRCIATEARHLLLLAMATLTCLLYLLSLSRRATSCPLWAKARSRCYTIARPARRTTRRAASSSRETTSSSATRAVIAPQTASTGWWAAACAHNCRSSRRSAGGGACAPLMACGRAPLCASTRATSCSTRTPRPRASRWTPTS